MKKVVQQRKDIAFYIKMYPLKSHPDAYEKAKGIVCRGTISALDDVFAGKPAPKGDCPTTEVDRNIELAAKLDITGTPAIILPNGVLKTGYMQAGDLIKVIDEAGKKKSLKAPQSKAKPAQKANKAK
jgi:thiol:disulfide interchange protein DsbC